MVANTTDQQPTGRAGATRVGARIGTWLAYGVWTMGTLFLVAALVLMRVGDEAPDTAYQVVLVLIYLALSLGAWVAAHRPANPTGWLLCGPPFGILATQAITLYVEAALTPEPLALPGVRWAAWIGNWIFIPIVATGPWLLLLFPDGRLPSRRWRPYAVFLLILTGLLLVTAALQPGPTERRTPL
jgi:two-component system, NarL family, sensor kinase